MKNKNFANVLKLRGVAFALLPVLVMPGLPDIGKLVSPFLPAASREIRVESSANPEVIRLQPILPRLRPGAAPIGSSQAAGPESAQTQAVQSQSLGPNLIPNSSVETAGSGGVPASWLKGGYGTNTRVLTYPVAGFNSPRGVKVQITSYTSGDAKWYFTDVPVTAGKTYQFSDYYSANIPSIVTVRFKSNTGAFSYKDIATPGPAGSYANVVAEFTVPADTVSLTVFHLIKQAGSLTTDEFSLNEVAQPPPPPPTNNLIANPDFEAAGTSGNPASWIRGGWGTNTRVFSYPAAGVGGSKAARVAVTSYTSGDAKWYFVPVAVSHGTYAYSVAYKSTVTTYLAAQIEHTNGTFSFKDLATVPSGSFATVSADFSVPATVKKVTVFLLLKSVGDLTIDNASLVFKAAPTGIFTTGAVSLTFDDGWLSQYDNALPKLESANFPGTFYIVTGQMADDGFSGYMSEAQVRDVFTKGHEIGAHTRTHRALSTLSAADQQNEIQGSRQDLLAMSVGPILSFAYPFGSYNATTLQIVKDSGFTSARNSMGGRVDPLTDEYQLPRFSVEVNTTFAQVQSAIDTAIANKEWLILVFHQVNNGTDRYTVSPATFNQIVDYLDQQNIPVVSVTEGRQSMQ